MATPLVPIDSDLDTAARLVLVDQPDTSLIGLVRTLRTQGDHQVDVREIREVWTRYHGWGLTRPTHDIDTGRRHA